MKQLYEWIISFPKQAIFKNLCLYKNSIKKVIIAPIKDKLGTVLTP